MITISTVMKRVCARMERIATDFQEEAEPVFLIIITVKAMAITKVTKEKNAFNEAETHSVFLKKDVIIDI